MKLRFALCLIILGLMWLKHQQRSEVKPIPVVNHLPVKEALNVAATQPAVQTAQPINKPVEKFQDMLERDHFCDAAHNSMNQAHHRQQFLRSLGFEMDSRYRELTDDNSPLNSDASAQNYTSPIARFTQALRLSGLLVGANEAHATDLNAAWELLNQLHREDPYNAAYPLFRLVVEHDLQKTPEDLRATAEALLAANHMNSLYTEFGREVFKKMQANASKFTAGIDFLSTLPMPDYQSVRQAVLDLDMDFPGLAANLGQMMVQPGLQAAGNSMSWTFNALEYSLGRVLAPELDAPKIGDLDKTKYGTTDRWQRLIDIDEKIWGACDLETQERFRSEARDWNPL